ncbi:hypothetical protein C370_06904, partial [Cryptococcus neoformans A1-35-8]
TFFSTHSRTPTISRTPSNA